jgi:hypothetical protein
MNLVYFLLYFNLKTGRVDECETAAEIYQCGRNVEPNVTNQIFTLAKGNAIEVIKILLSIVFDDRI